MSPFALSTLQLASSLYQDPEEALIATAQAILETGDGRSVPGGNLFGIKGPGGTHRTWEVVNGKRVNTTASFRQYGSPEESIAGRLNFLQSNPRYRKAGYFDASTAEEKADALQRAGYATDPQYSRKLRSIIADLRQTPPGESQVTTYAYPSGEKYEEPSMQAPPIVPAQSGMPWQQPPQVGQPSFTDNLMGNPFLMMGLGVLGASGGSPMQNIARGMMGGLAMVDRYQRDQEERELQAWKLQQGPAPTAAMRNYEYLRSRNVPEQEARERAFGAGGVTIQNLPAPPSGYGYADPARPELGLKPIPGGPAAQPSEGERASLSYWERMQSATEQLSKIAEAPQQVGGVESYLDSILADTGKWGAWLRSSEGQQYENAATQWIRAKLRKESGAAITDSEWTDEYTAFFPQPGDSDEVKRQKVLARQVAEDAMYKQAGRATIGADAPVRRFRFNPATGQLETR